ncbi:gametogenetin-like [Chamaea fasciata]|uniref:gametogenetin-like n=1 Tax=Chamaea fasciata TaxID=190680 RepID=UPI00336AC27D
MQESSHDIKEGDVREQMMGADGVSALSSPPPTPAPPPPTCRDQTASPPLSSRSPSPPCPARTRREPEQRRCRAQPRGGAGGGGQERSGGGGEEAARPQRRAGAEGTAMLVRRSGGMRRGRGAGLAALAAVLLAVAVVRAQVQQEPSLETTEGIGINISCSHPKIQTNDYIHWYRQLPGRGPELLASIFKEFKELPDSLGHLRVSADRRSSALWLRRPGRGDAAVYYCALGPRAEEPGLRPGTNRRGRGRAGPGAQRRPRPAGGAAAPPAGPRAAPQLLPLPRARPHRHRTAPHGPAHTPDSPPPALTHSPRTARHRLAPSPASAGHPTAAACASASAFPPPATAAAAVSRPCKAKSWSLGAPAVGADKASAVTRTQELIHGVLSSQ